MNATKELTGAFELLNPLALELTRNEHIAHDVCGKGENNANPNE